MKKMLIAVLAATFLIASCGADTDGEPATETLEDIEVQAPSPKYTTHLSDQGVTVECGDFDGNVECWVIAYP